MFGKRRTPDELDALLRFYIGISLAMTLFGTMAAVLYSLIFVTQPMNAMAPNDAKFFELIFPIATFLTGTLSGIMIGGKGKGEAPAEEPPKPKAPESVE